jgi:hypothetical protein
MRSFARVASVLTLALATTGCEAPPPPCTADVSLLTYNVAGLPQGINDDQFPEQNIPQISPLLNAYDLVVVQEDFVYTAELRAELTHPFQSLPHEHTERFVNDGLNAFSVLPFDEELERVRWVECFGGTTNAGDCLANKGFAVSSHDLGCSDGARLPVINLHAEAGGDAEDIAARTAGIEQLVAFIGERFPDGPLIVAGDTNLDGFDAADEPLIERILEGANLQDACRFLGCGDEQIDRVFFRGGADLDVVPGSWRLADEFKDAEGNDLSDHPAVHVQLEVGPRGAR